jgi:cobyrinic acid a,c-diamide synthase
LAAPVPDPSRPLAGVVIAGTHSGAGKTTVTLGLIAALRRRGLTVQPFKVGPDFIDPLHHARAAGRRSRNLDGWMFEPDVNRHRFTLATADADVAVVEGVMGLFDGSEGRSDRGSTAEMARLLGLPVLLVVDAAAMARSAAALIHGFVSFDPSVNVAGVILNRVGGAQHADMIRDAVAGAVPILGALPRVASLAVPERHLGLHLPHEAPSDHVEQAADLIEAHVDLDRLRLVARIVRGHAEEPTRGTVKDPVRLAVARDESFCFYYEDNLELLRDAGAEIVEFSPIRDPLPAGMDGLYIGGGYPELHAESLSQNTATIEAVRRLAESGAPVYAECGGLMYLAQHLHVSGSSHPMCGVLPFSTKIPAGLNLAYVEVATTRGLFGPGRRVRGHLYHQSEIEGEADLPRCYEVRTATGQVSSEGYHRGNVLASYVHLHFASNPGIATAFVDACRQFRAGQSSAPAGSGEEREF